MVSLPDVLQAREAAARQRVEELQAEAAELAVRLEKVREDLSRLEITRETVTQVLASRPPATVSPSNSTITESGTGPYRLVNTR
jgi:hypothetical protein